MQDRGKRERERQKIIKNKLKKNKIIKIIIINRERVRDESKMEGKTQIEPTGRQERDRNRREAWK